MVLSRSAINETWDLNLDFISFSLVLDSCSCFSAKSRPSFSSEIYFMQKFRIFELSMT
jgi:hypothetical protein